MPDERHVYFDVEITFHHSFPADMQNCKRGCLKYFKMLIICIFKAVEVKRKKYFLLKMNILITHRHIIKLSIRMHQIIARNTIYTEIQPKASFNG